MCSRIIKHLRKTKPPNDDNHDQILDHKTFKVYQSQSQKSKSDAKHSLTDILNMEGE